SRSGITIAQVDYGNSTDLPNHLFYGNFTGTNTFAGTPAYAGTTTGWSIGRDGTYPAMWSYRATDDTDEKRWAWYHGYGASGRMSLLAWNDGAGVEKEALTFDRTGNAITGVVVGNATDLPTISLA